MSAPSVADNIAVEVAGVTFRNPVIVSACSLTNSYEGIKDLAAYGPGGIVTKTISPILLPEGNETMRMVHPHGYPMVASDQRVHVDEGVKMIAALRSELDIPIIANLIGYTNDIDTWVKLARQVADAGAHMVEIDLHCHTTPEQESPIPPHLAEYMVPCIGHDPALSGPVVEAVKNAVTVPVITKLIPTAADIIGVANAAVSGHTDVLSLLNSEFGIAGVDIHRGGRPLYDGLETQGGQPVSGEPVNPKALMYTAILCQRLAIPIISGGGVMSWEHAVERLMLGASLVAICAGIYLNGPQFIADVVGGISSFCADSEYEGVDSLRGVASSYFQRSPFWK